jgi:hypothetical protein
MQFMNNLFPALICFLFILSGIICALNRSWNEAVYSFAAAVLQIAVYFRPFS